MRHTLREKADHMAQMLRSLLCRDAGTDTDRQTDRRTDRLEKVDSSSTSLTASSSSFFSGLRKGFQCAPFGKILLFSNLSDSPKLGVGTTEEVEAFVGWNNEKKKKLPGIVSDFFPHKEPIERTSVDTFRGGGGFQGQRNRESEAKTNNFGQ